MCTIVSSNKITCRENTHFFRFSFLLSLYISNMALTTQPREVGARTCRASIRDKSRRSRLRKKPRRKIRYPTWTGVVGASEIEPRRETVSFFFSPFPSSPLLPPFFVEHDGGREWNRDALTISAASLAHRKNQTLHTDDDHG